jgi:hypothetical protein
MNNLTIQAEVLGVLRRAYVVITYWKVTRPELNSKMSYPVTRLTGKSCPVDTISNEFLYPVIDIVPICTKMRTEWPSTQKPKTIFNKFGAGWRRPTFVILTHEHAETRD